MSIRKLFKDIHTCAGKRLDQNFGGNFNEELKPCKFFYDKGDLGISEKYIEYGNKNVKRLLHNGYEFGCYRRGISKKGHNVVEYRCLGKDKKGNKCHAKIQERKDGKIIFVKPFSKQKTRKPKRKKKTVEKLERVYNSGFLSLTPAKHYPFYIQNPVIPQMTMIPSILFQKKSMEKIDIHSLRVPNRLPSPHIITKEDICELALKSNFKIESDNVKVYIKGYNDKSKISRECEVEIISIFDLTLIRKCKSSYLLEDKEINHIICLVMPDFKEDMDLTVNIIWSTINYGTTKILNCRKEKISKFVTKIRRERVFPLKKRSFSKISGIEEQSKGNQKKRVKL